MRRITTATRVGKVNMPAPLSKEFALLALLLAAVLWVGYAFAQEVFLNHQLNAQAADLRQQNASIAKQNDGYRRDILASSAGAAADACDQSKSPRGQWRRRRTARRQKKPAANPLGRS